MGKNQQINVVLKEEWWYTLENIIPFKRNSEETLDSMIQTQFQISLYYKTILEIKFHKVLSKSLDLVEKEKYTLLLLISTISFKGER